MLLSLIEGSVRKVEEDEKPHVGFGHVAKTNGGFMF